MRRVSSPPGIFSSLMTSAPMSASMSPQVGPAMTWHSSITLRPASGPCLAPMSAALELRLGLGEERAVADLEILGAEAGVVVFQFGWRQRARIEQALDEFFVPAIYQRRARGDALRGRVGFLLDFRVRPHAVDEP